MSLTPFPAPFLAGLALGLSLIVAIGAQNAFVLRQGLRGEHVLAVALTCALSDAALISLGIAGMGAAVTALPGLERLLRWAGAAFLLAYGAARLRAAWRGGAGLLPAAEASRASGPASAPPSLAGTLAVCLTLTWLNPHVWLDTVLLIGSVSARWPGEAMPFALGAISASFLFFFALAYGARLLRPLFARPAAWRLLDLGIALVMGMLAVALLIGAPAPPPL